MKQFADKFSLYDYKQYDVDVTGASMVALTLDNATIFNTGIGIGGEYPDNVIIP